MRLPPPVVGHDGSQHKWLKGAFELCKELDVSATPQHLATLSEITAARIDNFVSAADVSAAQIEEYLSDAPEPGPSKRPRLDNTAEEIDALMDGSYNEYDYLDTTSQTPLDWGSDDEPEDDVDGDIAEAAGLHIDEDASCM